MQYLKYLDCKLRLFDVVFRTGLRGLRDTILPLDVTLACIRNRCSPEIKTTSI